MAADADRVHRLARIPLTLRALVLVPLLAAGMDQARVSLVCPPGARSCLETAGQGKLGLAGLLMLVAYMAIVAGFVARFARNRKGLWIIATAGLWAACGGQALLLSALGEAAALGGGWPELLVFGAAAGAVLAFALRTLPELIRHLRPSVPRPVALPELVRVAPAAAPSPSLLRFARLVRDRAPPALA